MSRIGDAHKRHEEKREAAIEQARAQYQTDDVNIDDNAELSTTDEGVWVAAWVWVSNEELEE